MGLNRLERRAVKNGAERRASVWCRCPGLKTGLGLGLILRLLRTLAVKILLLCQAHVLKAAVLNAGC